MTKNRENESRRPWFSFNVQKEKQDKSATQLTWMNLVYGFASGTQFHGIPRAYRAVGYSKKLMWTVVVCTMIIFLLRNIFYITCNYLEWKTNVNIDIRVARQLPFPAVTICNLNSYKRSEISGSEIEKSIKSLSEGNDEPFDSDNDTNVLYNSIIEHFMKLPVNERKSYGFQYDELILYCRFASGNCRKMNKWKYVYNWKFGNCFVFNTQGNELSTKSGPDVGLRLLLNAKQDEYVDIGPISNKAGARILIHHPTVMPFPERVGLNVAPGFSTSIGIQMTLIQRTSEHGNCEKNNPQELNAFETEYPWTQYSLSVCEKTMWQKLIFEKCGCFDASMPPIQDSSGDGWDKVCDSRNKTQGQCLTYTYENYINQSPTCLEQCKRHKYQVTVSMALWPARYTLNRTLRIIENASIDIDKMRWDPVNIYDNLMQVEIYYNDLNYEIITQEPAYDSSSFTADLGGAMGLWFGASIVSLFEILEFFLDLLVLGCRHWMTFTRKVSEKQENKPAGVIFVKDAKL